MGFKAEPRRGVSLSCQSPAVRTTRWWATAAKAVVYVGFTPEQVKGPGKISRISLEAFIVWQKWLSGWSLTWGTSVID